MRNRLIRTTSLFFVAVFLMVCGTGCTQSPASTVVAADLPEMTLAELAKYDGKNSNPVYVAVDGLVYDLSGSSHWKNGSHNGFMAGADLSEAIKIKSPHGVSKLRGFPIVAKLKTS
ncbi:MAG: cytochrome b5 domain-containing protein [Pygmaiobacter sp.]|nr:cytochrome b5 domain-containing protein [Pygmaiobacter sp.]